MRGAVGMVGWPFIARLVLAAGAKRILNQAIAPIILSLMPALKKRTPPSRRRRLRIHKAGHCITITYSS